MTDEEELKAALDAAYEAEKKQKEEFEKAKQFFKSQGLYKGDFHNFEEEIFNDLMFVQHIGYVEVELYQNAKNTINHYSLTNRHFKVKDNKDLERFVFGEQTINYNDNEDEYDTYLVCQWCNFEDDYKGYILLPIKDGTYWCFYYQM